VIASISGKIQSIHENMLIIQVGGVGLGIHVPNDLAEDQTRVGQQIDLYTHMHVRENDISLYGFRSLEEKELFLILLGISGIGPRTALAVLSSFSPELLRGVISQGDASALTAIPGIGRKTAQRMMLDLKDKVKISSVVFSTPALAEGDADVINALTALGYSVAEAQSAVAILPENITELDQRILAALQSLGTL